MNLKLTLLVENNTQLESFYSLNLQTWVGAEILPKKNAEFSIKLLEENPDIALVITKARCGLEKSAELLHEYIKNSGKEIALIVIGKSSLNPEEVTHLATGLDIKPLVQLSAKALGVTAQDMAKLQVPEHFAIPINYFSALKRTVTDVYEQNLDNPNQYDLKLKELEDFDSEIIKSYITNGVAQLFVKKNDRLKFVTNVTQELVALIKMDDLDDNEQVQAAESNQKLLHEKLKYIGITEETVALSQKNLKTSMRMAKKFPRLGKLMARLMANKAGYLFKHIQVLTYIGNHMLEHIDWGNAEQKEKFAFIAFFHDIVLETDEQARIYSDADLKSSNLDSKQKDLVNKHAQLSAELVTKYPHAPMGSDIIIRQHHGITHGIGFAETYAGNLSPMTIVFILAEDFTDTLITSGRDFNIEKKVAQMRERYQTQRFQKIIDILEQITI
jgi:response regulator RpfG family c-di-GMP phosphodiesterase